MKKFFLLAAISIITTSCVSLDGNLLVTEKISLKKKGGFLNLSRKDVTIEANDYDAHITVLGKNNFALILNRGDERISLPIKSKNELAIPSFSGNFRISHSDIDQPYDLVGTLNTNIHTSPTEELVENCTWETKEKRCHIECADVLVKDEAGATRKENHCQKLCDDYTVTHQGRREIVFHYRSTHRETSLEFIKPENSHSVAHFQGTSNETEKIIERQGICN